MFFLSTARPRYILRGTPIRFFDKDYSSVICQFCSANNDKVIDSRESDGGKIVRRRRECLSCSRRFTTYERVDQAVRLTVVKRDGTHVPFNRENIMRGVVAACGKRAISEQAKELLVTQIEEAVHQEFDREVPSAIIGERVMHKLRDLDEVAYIRYASEYHQFRSVDDLRKELDQLEKRIKDVKNQQPLFLDAQKGAPGKADANRAEPGRK